MHLIVPKIKIILKKFENILILHWYYFTIKYLHTYTATCFYVLHKLQGYATINKMVFLMEDSQANCLNTYLSFA